MTQLIPFEKPEWAETVDPASTFVPTETGTEIMRTLRFARIAGRGAVAMIAGGSGVGKTAALAEWERANRGESVYVKVARGEGNPSHVALAIFDAMNIGKLYPRGKDLSVVRREMQGFLHGRMLLVDEAQHMEQRHKLSGTTGSSFDWLLAAAEDGGFPLILFGDLTFPTIRDRHAALDGRVRKTVVVKTPTAGDVAAVMANRCATGPTEVALMTLVAARPGGLRHVESVIAEAQIEAAPGVLMTAPMLKMAALRLGMKGVN